MRVTLPIIFFLFGISFVFAASLPLIQFLYFIFGIAGILIIYLIIETDRNNKKFDVFNPKYYVLIGLLIFIYIGMVKNAFSEYLPSYNINEVCIICIVCVVSTFSYLIPYIISSKKQRITPHHMLYTKKYIKIKSLTKITCIYFFLSNIGIRYLIPKLGGLHSPFYNIIGYVGYMGPIAGLFAGYLLFIKKEKKSFMLKFILFMIFTSAFFLGTSRTPIAYIILPLLLLFIRERHLRQQLNTTHYRINEFKVLILTIVLMYIGGIYKASNIIYVEGKTLKDININYALEHAFKFEFVDAFDNIFKLKEIFIDQDNLLWGKSFFAFIVNPIPRYIWPAKPKSLGYILAERFYTEETEVSLATSFIGELLVNFSYIGAIVGYLILGIFSKLFYLKYKKNYRNDVYVIPYTLLLTMLILESRGDFLTINIRGLSFILFSWLGIKFSLKKLNALNNASGSNSGRIL